MLLSDCARDALTYGTQAEEKGTTPTTRTGTQKKTGESPKANLFIWPVYSCRHSRNLPVLLNTHIWAGSLVVRSPVGWKTGTICALTKKRLHLIFYFWYKVSWCSPRMASNFIIIIFQQPSEFWDYRHDSLIPFFLSASTYQFFFYFRT